MGAYAYGYVFAIPGNPLPLERARTGRGRRHYTPEKTRVYQEQVAVWAKIGGVREPLEGPLSLTATFFRANNRRVDVSNLLKSLEDALIGVAFHDDSQITRVTATKKVEPANPRTEVWIQQLA